MKLAVADIQNDAMFREADFEGLGQFHEIKFLKFPSREPLDGSVFRSFPADTTHVVTRLADRLGSEELAHLKCLQYVGLAYTGWWDKYFDVAAVRERGVTVTNNPEYAPNAVAEAIFACVLEEYRGLRGLRLGDPEQQSPIGRELRGRTFGIIGMGHIGQAVASTATALGMRVISASRDLPPCVHAVERAELFRGSDVLGVFVPKSAGAVIGRAEFVQMRQDALIVNPSGHENLATDALESYLKENPGATYSYLAMPESEYFQRLSELANARLYPLFTGSTHEARQRRKVVTLKNLREYAEGQVLRNRVI
jgi:glycerate dehydrogenase